MNLVDDALTHVTAYVILSPLAGTTSDRIDRKQIMVISHLARMIIVCFLPFVTQPWQIYGIVLALNVFSAFFTPTYTATIPLVTSAADYPTAIANTAQNLMSRPARHLAQPMPTRNSIAVQVR
ncbi:MAG: MFS transporter [Thainema sp.]